MNTKNNSLIALFILGTSISASAQTVAPTPTPRDTFDEIAAQAQMIGDLVSETKRKIEDKKPSGDDFAAKDYWNQREEFQNKIKVALDHFQEKLGNQSKGILSELVPEMEAYNKIVQSKTLDQGAKKVLLEGAGKEVESKSMQVQKEYLAAIDNAVVEAFGEFPVRGVLSLDYDHKARSQQVIYSPLKVISESNQSRSIFYGFKSYGLNGHFADDKERNLIRTKSRTEIIYPMSSRDASLAKKAGCKDTQMIYEEYFYPLIAKGCQGKTCLALKASDLSRGLPLLVKALSKTIEMKLLDSSSVFLLQDTALNDDVRDGRLDFLIMNSNYPTDLNITVFDVKN